MWTSPRNTTKCARRCSRSRGSPIAAPPGCRSRRPRRSSSAPIPSAGSSSSRWSARTILRGEGSCARRNSRTRPRRSTGATRSAHARGSRAYGPSSKACAGSRVRRPWCSCPKAWAARCGRSSRISPGRRRRRRSRCSCCCSTPRAWTCPRSGRRRPHQENRDLETGSIYDLASLARGTVLRVIGAADQPFERIARELLGYYLVGFAPETGDRDGKSHKIAVRVARERATVRARGLLSIPVQAPGPQQLVAAALRSPFVERGLGLKLTSFARPAPGGKVKLLLAAEILGASRPLSVGFLVRAADGKVVASRLVQGIEAGDTARVPFAAEAAVDPGTYTLRLAAVDAAGRRGSVQHEARAAVVAAGGLQLSDLVLAGVPGEQGLVPAVDPEMDAEGLVAMIELASQDKGTLASALRRPRAGRVGQGPGIAAAAAADEPGRCGGRPLRARQRRWRAAAARRLSGPRRGLDRRQAGKLAHAPVPCPDPARGSCSAPCPAHGTALARQPLRPQGAAEARGALALLRGAARHRDPSAAGGRRGCGRGGEAGTARGHARSALGRDQGRPARGFPARRGLLRGRQPERFCSRSCRQRCAAAPTSSRRRSTWGPATPRAGRTRTRSAPGRRPSSARRAAPRSMPS